MHHWCLPYEVIRKNTHRVPKRDAVGILAALYLTNLAIHAVSHGLSR
jgi:hypothetical protein